MAKPAKRATDLTISAFREGDLIFGITKIEYADSLRAVARSAGFAISAVSILGLTPQALRRHPLRGLVVKYVITV